MASPLLLAAIAGGSSLLGGLFNFFGQSSTNKINREIAREQNALNYKMFNEQNALNSLFWDKNNAYNTPLNQRLRYEQAGINPYMALGNITPGIAQAQTSATPAQAVGYQHQNALSGIADGVSNAGASAVNAYLQTSATKANIRLAEANASKAVQEAKAVEIDNASRDSRNNAHIRNIDAQTDKYISDRRFAEVQANRIEQLAPEERRHLTASIELIGKQANVAESVERMNFYQFKHLMPAQLRELNARTRNVLQSTLYLVQQGRLADAQTVHVFEQSLESQLRQANIQASTDQIRALIAPQINYINAQARQASASAVNIGEKTKYLDDENAVRWIDAGCKVLNSGSNFFSNFMPWRR